MQKRVAVSMRMVQSPAGEWRDALAEDWASYLGAQNISPVLVPNDAERCPAYLEGVDGLILTGGDDIVLRDPEAKSDDPLARRDRTEMHLLEEAMKRGLPVLGVCRGMQFLQWFFGGTLEKSRKEHVGTEHAVTCTGNLTKLLPVTLRVNSFHENGIAAPAEPFSVCAKDADGLIEAFDDASRKLLGVLWHPERPFSDPESARAHARFIRNFLELFP